MNREKRLQVHHWVYFILLTLLAGSQAVSNWMMSGMQILLAVNWLLEWNMREKIQRARRQPLLTAWLVFAGVSLLWNLFGPDYHTGFDYFFSQLPLLAIPLIVLTSRPLSTFQLRFLIAFYITTVFVATIIGCVRLVTIPDLPYRDIVPYISNIRFSLNVCLSIIIIAYNLLRRTNPNPILSGLKILLILYFLYFLFLLRSYTGLSILLLTALVLLLLFSRRIASRRLRRTLVVAYSLTIVAVVLVASLLVIGYYRPVPIMTQPLPVVTANGNPYQHRDDGLVENGNLVNNYVCPLEIEQQWPRVSSMPLYDTTPNGYTVYPTLIRYLNALGTTKDSAGISLLTPSDIEAIEKGIANPVYIHGSPLRKMAYVLLYEYESSRVLGSVAGFSLLQRFHIWRCGWQLFVSHPLFGVGTGNIHNATEQLLVSQQSPLAGRNFNLHNQYLSFLVMFGLVGTLVISFFFFRAFRRSRILAHPLPAATLTVVLLSFLTENTLSTLAGCVFSVFFFTLFSTVNNNSF